jgi:hypothetical protein
MGPIHGVTLEMLADITSKHGELRAQYGEQQGRAELAQFLSSLGLSEQVWAFAHNAWWERFRADPTGRLEAQFHQMLSQRTLKAHFGDVRDMTQDQIEGVTLDTYAKLCVAMGKPGIDPGQVAREHGLPSVEQWQKVNAGWVAKMSQDTTHALTMQFGTLYQKHAGPSFAEQQMSQTAAILAKSNEPRDVTKTPQKDLTQGTLLLQLRSDSRNERWQAARWLAHQWRKGDPSTTVNLECIPVLIEVLEQHDEHTVSNAEDAARKLTDDLGQYTDLVRSAMARCFNRATEKLATLEAAFAPIQNKAVPERITLQSRIQDYTSLAETLEGMLSSWPAAAPAPSVGIVGNSGPAVSASPVTKPHSSGRVPKGLLAIPALVVIAFVVYRTMLGATTPNASTASASEPAAATVVSPGTTATANGASAPPAAKATSTKAKH